MRRKNSKRFTFPILISVKLTALGRPLRSRSCKFSQTCATSKDIAYSCTNLYASIDYRSHLTANELTGELPKDFFELSDTIEKLYSEYDLAIYIR